MNAAPSNSEPAGAATKMGLGSVASRLAVLPDDKFIAAIRVLMLAADKPEVVALLDDTRDRLRALRPSRTISLKRQFCMPFEELLATSSQRRPGRVLRSAIEPIWAKLSERAPGQIEALQRELSPISAHEPKKVAALSARLWELAAERLAEPWPGAPHDLSRIVGALAAAPEIENFRRRVPGRGLTELSREVVDLILESVKTLRQRNASLDAYFLVVANHLACASTLLGMLQSAQVPMPVAISAELDAMAVDELAQQGEWLKNKASTLSADTIASETDRLMQMMTAARDSVGRAQRKEFDIQANALTPTLRKALKEQVIDVAPPVIDDVLAGNPDKATVLVAEAHARALRRARRSAQVLGLGSETDKVFNNLDRKLRDAIEQGFQRRAQPASAPSDVPDASLFRNLRMLELLMGSRAIEPLMARLTRKSDAA